MSDAFAAVRDIAAGRRPANFALLQNTRFEGFGVRAFGREPILGLFARAPIAFSDNARVHETPRNLAAIEGDKAAFADLHDGRVVRLWAFGAEAVGVDEPSISVGRDLDLSQSEDDVFFDPADHPDLAAADGGVLRSVATTLARPASGPMALAVPDVFSVRVFVTRAFSAGSHVVALLVLAGSVSGERRKPFGANALLSFGADAGEARDPVLTLDTAGMKASIDAAWTPRV